MRRAWGNIADSTRVTIANVNSEFKDLEIAIVKATNHVEAPPKEKHIRTIFAFTSVTKPRADVQYCIQGLARRLAKTSDWLVAIKCLIVIHRTLREGDPTFREELINFMRTRNFLNLSYFKDESNPAAWEYSAWVRTYADYLDQRLATFRTLKYDVEAERSSGHSRTRELDTPDLLEHLPALQNLLNNLMGCQPEGASVSNHVIQAALGLVLKESFKLYRAINDGIINLVDKFFEMQKHDASAALEIYKRAGIQAGKLAEFYEICKSLDLARSFQFPTLEQPPQSFLSTMEEYVKEGKPLTAPKEEPPKPAEKEQSKPLEPPPVQTPEPPNPAVVPPPEPIADLLGLEDDKTTTGMNPSDLEESNALALAIVPQGNGYGANPLPTPAPNLADFGTTGWELALVSAPSSTTINPTSNFNVNESSTFAGGLDKLTLDSLYEDAVRRSPYSTPPASFNAGAGQNQILALPAPPGSMQPQASFHSQDPFFASSKYAPPPSVQMAAMAHQQQNLLVANQYQAQVPSYTQPTNPFGMPSSVPQYGGYPPVNASLSSNPFASPYGPANPPNPFATPAPLPQQVSPQQYGSNPFGNPSLL